MGAYLPYADSVFTGYEGQFFILDENVSTQGVKYDYQSVMQFIHNAFGRDGVRTIRPLKEMIHLANTYHPTSLDILHLDILYCKGIYTLNLKHAYNNL